MKLILKTLLCLQLSLRFIAETGLLTSSPNSHLEKSRRLNLLTDKQYDTFFEATRCFLKFLFDSDLKLDNYVLKPKNGRTGENVNNVFTCSFK